MTGSLSMTLACIATLLVAMSLLPVARILGWVDRPDARKTHAAPTPLVGGVAIFLVFFIFGAMMGIATPALFVASAIVLVVGVVDDRWPLSASVRFLAQGAACLVMVFWGGVMLEDFGRLFWDQTVSLGYLAVPITVFSALGVINAFNMIDGLDGLSGSIYLVVAGSMAWLAALAGRSDIAILLALSMACVIGFLALNARLPWNRRARTFLGDAGSVLLGFWLAWSFIALGNDNLGEPRAFAPMTAVWIFGLPLLDTTRLMSNRWRSGRSAFEADRHHLHHAFLAAGFSARETWFGIVALTLAFAAVGIVFERAGVPEYIRFYAFIAVGLAYFFVMKRAWSGERFLGRPLAELSAEN